MRYSVSVYVVLSISIDWTVAQLLVDCGFFRYSFIFFFKQKSAYEMRISDWSSDVCSSDLAAACGVTAGQVHGQRDRLAWIDPDPGRGVQAAECDVGPAAAADDAGVWANRGVREDPPQMLLPREQ